MDKVVGDKIQEFFSQYKLRKYPKGQILILNGNPTNHIYNLKSGVVKQYDISYRGDEVILNMFKEPAFFPMSLAINGGESSYTYEAKTDLEVRQAPVEDVIAFVKANPDVLYDLLSRVYSGVEGLLGRMAHLMASSAKGRLMFELLIESRRFGEATSGGGCILKTSEKELGSRAGLSRETVSREINKLAKDGLLSIDKHQIIIKDLQLFETRLGTVL
jgi:CRP-like cAMP-binding protein